MQLEIIPVGFLYQIAPTINEVEFLYASTFIVVAICSGNAISYINKLKKIFFLGKVIFIYDFVKKICQINFYKIFKKCY